MIEFKATVDFEDELVGDITTEEQYAAFNPDHIIMCIARPDGKTIIRISPGEDFPVDEPYWKVVSALKDWANKR